VTTSNYTITIDEQRMLPLRGDGRIITTTDTYYFWYRVRQNHWYMGIHTAKPIRNTRCEILEYDDAPVFHCADIKDTHIKPGDLDVYINACVTSFKGPQKTFTSSPT